MSTTTIAGLLLIAVPLAFNAAFALLVAASTTATSCASPPPTS